MAIEFIGIVFFIFIFMFSLVVILNNDSLFKDRLTKQIKNKNISEDSYKRYAKFYGNTVPTDKEFIDKLKMIYHLITAKHMTNIKEIAKLANCSYNDCIIKIRYLKNKRQLSDKYYVDEVNGIINVCSAADQKLLNKYKKYIYYNHLQVPDIATRLPGATRENREALINKIWNELIYLDDKDLINGIVLNKVDKKIVYYAIEKHKTYADKVTVSCPNCGALNEVERGNKIQCEYCGTILEVKLKIEEEMEKANS